MAGAAIASVLNVVDGLVVIGGGVAGASKYILPALITELRAQLTTFREISFHAFLCKYIMEKMNRRELVS